MLLIDAIIIVANALISLNEIVILKGVIILLSESKNVILK